MVISRRLHGRLVVFLASALPLLLTLSTTFMAWKAICVLAASPTPIVCVTSESMAPAFHRGDLLILSNWQPHIHVGDIPVVWFPGNPLPMVHRAISVWHTAEGEQFLTKGDNNEKNDVSLYPPGRTSVTRKEVLGLVRGYVPFVGRAVITFQQSISTRRWR